MMRVPMMLLAPPMFAEFSGTRRQWSTNLRISQTITSSTMPMRSTLQLRPLNHDSFGDITLRRTVGRPDNGCYYNLRLGEKNPSSFPFPESRKAFLAPAKVRFSHADLRSSAP